MLEFSIGVQRKGEKTKKKKKNAFCQHSLDVVSYPPPPPRPPSILLPLPYFNWFKLLCDIVESGPTKRERERELDEKEGGHERRGHLKEEEGRGEIESHNIELIVGLTFCLFLYNTESVVTNLTKELCC